jgi:hypothetical protein
MMVIEKGAKAVKRAWVIPGVSTPERRINPVYWLVGREFARPGSVMGLD